VKTIEDEGAGAEGQEGANLRRHHRKIRKLTDRSEPLQNFKVLNQIASALNQPAKHQQGTSAHKIAHILRTQK